MDVSLREEFLCPEIMDQILKYLLKGNSLTIEWKKEAKPERRTRSV